MIEIVPVTMGNIDAFREVRLRALKEDPTAFGSTYAHEAGFSQDEWNARVERWNGNRGIGFLAMRAASTCGLVGALLEEDGLAQLVSMWTAPESRRAGIGRMLVEAVIGWAREHGVATLRLMVTSCNPEAEQFYQRLGFERTGNCGPYPNDPAVVEWEMTRVIVEAAGVGS
jgi:GNAT superfamily N-acetyltransferase